MKQVELYNHNKTTYENITRIFETSNKCATVQPTGSGKSFLIFKFAQDNSDKTIVVFEPNKQIIGRVSEQMKEYGIDNIKFYTYQKLNSQHKRDEISIDNADYICLDELHRIKAKQWEQAVIAIQDKFPNAKVLGLTATPERMDGQNIIDYFGAELACNITLGDAIVNKILPCPTYISALYTFDEEIQRVSDKIDRSVNSDEEKNNMRAELEVARKQLENALGVSTILKKHIPDSDGKYIVFCQNVEHLNTMESTIEDWFIQAGFDVHIYEVHTKNPNHKKEYNQFQSDNSDCIKLCLCVDMFNEGVHLEGISGVILLRPTQSNIIYFQQIGRAISASDRNIPIIFDLVNNGSNLGGGSFRTEIESAVERQRETIVKRDSEYDKEIFNIGNFHIYDYVKDSLDVLNEIENRCVDDFYFRLKQLEEYKDKWGDCNIIKKKAENWSGLWEWATCIRNKTNNYSSQKIELLNSYGFIWDKKEWRRTKIIEYVKEYKKHYDSSSIKRDYITSDGFKLGEVIDNIKSKIKKSQYVDKNLIDDLSTLGINLYRKSLDEQWLEYYNIAYEYVCVLGNIIEYNTIYKGYNIGSWIYTNKRSYKQGKLAIWRKELLNNICDIKKINNIEINDFINLLQDFLLYGNKLTFRTKYKGINVGQRLSMYKQNYKHGKLSEEYYRQFLKLGIDLAKEGSLM